MRVLEKTIEAAVVNYAKKKGCLVRKMNGLGARSWPDRLFLGPSGRCCWIEFKTPNGKLTPLQGQLHEKMFAMGHKIYVVRDVAFGKKLIDALL